MTETDNVTPIGLGRMIARPFPTGAIVWLKSGSPAMTVAEVVEDKQPALVSVDWFDGDLFSHRNSFHKDQLTQTPTMYPASLWNYGVSPPISDENMNLRDESEQRSDTLDHPQTRNLGTSEEDVS